MRTSRHPSRASAPAFAPESLERRTLMSVSVSYDKGKLKIVGTEGDDQIVVTADASNNLIVNGAVVGSAASLKDVEIDSLGGNDLVDVRNLSASNNVEIDTGAGTDNV